MSGCSFFRQLRVKLHAALKRIGLQKAERQRDDGAFRLILCGPIFILGIMPQFPFS